MRVNKLLLLINKDYYSGLVGTGAVDQTGAIITINGSALKRNGGVVVFNGGLNYSKAGRNVDQTYDSLNNVIDDRFDDTQYYTAN